jgi:hypothetical protein
MSLNCRLKSRYILGKIELYWYHPLIKVYSLLYIQERRKVLQVNMHLIVNVCVINSVNTIVKSKEQ